MKLLFSILEISDEKIYNLIVKEKIYSKIINLFTNYSNSTIVLVEAKKFIIWTIKK
jgi:hypothetical protein